jgi:ribonuclease VapC
MMIDSSAILAIAFQEPEAERMAVAISADPVRRMSAVNWLETLMVVEARYGAESADNVLLILQDFEIELVPFDREQMLEARSAWQRFGKGRHPAALNLGDCCAYAAAVIRSEPLLSKGEDFSHIDVQHVNW